jgi:hypothetical protein
MAVLSAISDHAEPLALGVERHDWTAWQTLAPVWSELFARCARPTLFLAPENVATWLDVFGPSLAPELLVFREIDGTPAGACLLVRRTDRKGPFFVRRVFLNTAGEDEGDSPCIEYNELLCVPGYEERMAYALREYLDRGPWDAFHAEGVLAGPSHEALRIAFADARELDDDKPSYYIDLEAVRASKKDFIDKLASRERTRIRQNLRRYGELGELRYDVATTIDEALAFLERMAVLHQQTWQSRGRPGAFASELFVAYHRALIARCFPLGTIELVHVRAGDATVGYHYNFVFGNRTFFYQCGYDYALGDKLTPGVIIHALAIRRSIELGRIDYELMAGDVEYKRRLSTDARRMHWLVWQAPTMKMRGFELARMARRALRAKLRKES